MWESQWCPLKSCIRLGRFLHFSSQILHKTAKIMQHQIRFLKFCQTLSMILVSFKFYWGCFFFKRRQASLLIFGILSFFLVFSLLESYSIYGKIMGMFSLCPKYFPFLFHCILYYSPLYLFLLFIRK